MPAPRNALHPKKLALTKWTAIAPVSSGAPIAPASPGVPSAPASPGAPGAPVRREKHFLVTRVPEPDDAGVVAWVELEAVLTRGTRRIDWRELTDASRWQRGWA